VRTHRIVEAAHPVPDAAGESAALRILAKVQNLNENDRVLALISGGGSALLAAPAAGVSLAEKRRSPRRCSNPGPASARSTACANTSRPSRAAAWRRRLAGFSVLTLAISDVPGDDPAVIASGPTVADPTTAVDALKVLDFYGIAIPLSLRARLESGALETPKPGDPRLAHSEFRLIASPRQMLEAAANARANSASRR
jgi:glycerate 2-kinase